MFHQLNLKVCYKIQYILSFLYSAASYCLMFIDKQDNTLFYEIGWDNKQINSKERSLANLFRLIEGNKNALKIETYSISQTTLEDVFLAFASSQKNEENKNGIQIAHF